MLVPERLSVFPVQLADLLQNERITITYLVPSILSLMITYGKLEAHDLSASRAILFAGEVFPMKSSCGNSQQPFRMPISITCTARPKQMSAHLQSETDRPHSGSDKPVPIGLACENTEVFAVDSTGSSL